MQHYVASGTCSTCGLYEQVVVDNVEDATLMVLHAHKGHIFTGTVNTKPITKSEAYDIERSNKRRVA